MAQQEKIKAIGLFSGGLDSRLAIKVIQQQDIEVIAVNFYTGFCYATRNRQVGRWDRTSTQYKATEAAEALGVPLQVIDVSQEYIPVILNPRHGYGSGMNPCLDCRIFMLRQAKAYMAQVGAHFVFTGEVLGQRPKSQHREHLQLVERQSGLEGLLLRPLSAKLLPPTVPEQKGWVDRERLLAIGGRGRKEQIALAEALGMTDYPQPSGGCCFLPDPNFARRLQDFIDHYSKKAVTPEQIMLLAVGRHFRLDPQLKVIVGRHKGENDYLVQAGAGQWQFTTIDHPGPTALTADPLTPEQMTLVARLVARYSDGKREPQVRVQARLGAQSQTLTVAPLPPQAVDKFRL